MANTTEKSKKAKVKRGSTVVILSGNDKGKRGKVLAITMNKKGNQVALVEGIALKKRHRKGDQENPEGSIVERESYIDCSNIMPVERYDARGSKKSR